MGERERERHCCSVRYCSRSSGACAIAFVNQSRHRPVQSRCLSACSERELAARPAGEHDRELGDRPHRSEPFVSRSRSAGMLSLVSVHLFVFFLWPKVQSFAWQLAGGGREGGGGAAKMHKMQQMQQMQKRKSVRARERERACSHQRSDEHTLPSAKGCLLASGSTHPPWTLQRRPPAPTRRRRRRLGQRFRTSDPIHHRTHQGHASPPRQFVEEQLDMYVLSSILLHGSEYVFTSMNDLDDNRRQAAPPLQRRPEGGCSLQRHRYRYGAPSPASSTEVRLLNTPTSTTGCCEASRSGSSSWLFRAGKFTNSLS